MECGGCRGKFLICTIIQIHFVYRHLQYTVVIMEEGNLPNTS